MSSGCERYEKEGLEQVERGEALDPHFGACADCLAAQEVYQRMGAGLARLAKERAPSGFEAEVWAEIGRRQVKRRVWKVAPAFGAMAAAGLLLLAWPGAKEGPGLQVEVRDVPGEAVRGISATPGDVLTFRGNSGGRAHSELRLYRDGVRVLRCSAEPPCSRTGRVLSAAFPAAELGTYEAILLLSDRPISSPAGGGGQLRVDLDHAVRAGAGVVTSPPVNVY